ncbi:MAG: amidohydrolase family protein, partial [Betaproteobacteria bacterium]
SDPSRFIGLAKIPVSGIDAALAELRFVTETLKMPGIVLDRWPNGREGSARESVAFWEAAEAYAVPISVYCSLTGGDDPVELVGGGRTPELGNELPSIIYANICDRFPNLKFVVADPSPGWAPFVFEGLNESYQRTIGSRQVNLGDPEAMPADYMRAFFWYTIQDDRFCVLNRHYFGPAHLMWGSFTATLHSQWPNSPQQFGRLTSGLPAESIAALVSGVVKNLYGLEGASSFSQEEIRDFKSYAVI